MTKYFEEPGMKVKPWDVLDKSGTVEEIHSFSESFEIALNEERNTISGFALAKCVNLEVTIF